MGAHTSFKDDSFRKLISFSKKSYVEYILDYERVLKPGIAVLFFLRKMPEIGLRSEKKNIEVFHLRQSILQTIIKCNIRGESPKVSISW